MLRYIQGVDLDFREKVSQGRLPHPIKMNASQVQFVDTKIAELLRENCIQEVVSSSKNSFMSNIFLVAKKDRQSWRFIVNLVHLNKFLTPKFFKMEGLKDICRLAEKDSYICVCDIRDSYSHVYVRPRYQSLLSFNWKEKTYKMTSLPNGLKSSPFIFSMIGRQLAGHLRAQGVKLVIYIDDIIIIGKTKHQCKQFRDLVLDTLSKCGFLVNYKKSQLEPSKLAEALGFAINTSDQTIKLTVNKREGLIKTFEQALNKDRLTIKHFARLVGLAVSTFYCFPFGKMYYRDLEKSKLKYLRLNNYKWSKFMPVSETDRENLLWWLRTFYTNKPFHYAITQPTLTVRTDASLTSWGIHVLKHGRTGAPFSSSDSKNNINTLEIMAVKYGLQSFQHVIRNKHFLLQLDNLTGLCDLKRLGTMRNDTRNSLVRDIFNILEQQNSKITVQYIPTDLNLVADAESRNTMTSLSKLLISTTTEWVLDDDTFQILKAKTPQMSYDLFATNISAKYSQFCSRIPTPNCSAVDAFTLDWCKHIHYAFPPFSLLNRCFEYLRSLRVPSIFFVIPWIRTAVWFPVMLDLLVEEPVFLPPNTAKLLRLPFPSPILLHPMHRTLQLCFVHLSGV